MEVKTGYVKIKIKIECSRNKVLKNICEIIKNMFKKGG